MTFALLEYQHKSAFPFPLRLKCLTYVTRGHQSLSKHHGFEDTVNRDAIQPEFSCLGNKIIQAERSENNHKHTNPHGSSNFEQRFSKPYDLYAESNGCRNNLESEEF